MYRPISIASRRQAILSGDLRACNRWFRWQPAQNPQTGTLLALYGLFGSLHTAFRRVSRHVDDSNRQRTARACYEVCVCKHGMRAMFTITKRLPCSVCGFDSFSRDGWFLVAEDRWLDRLRIFAWHPSLASENGFQSVCGRQHLNVLIGYWLEQANLRLLSFAEERLQAASDSHFCNERKDFCLGAKLIGELSVYREGS